MEPPEKPGRFILVLELQMFSDSDAYLGAAGF
jgi:hypothetical protein